jgi:hypothetical protein
MPTLEAQLTALTQEFVAKLVDALRNASFAEVASLSPARLGSSPPAPRASRRPAASQAEPRAAGPGRKRQNAGARAELGERILATLHDAAQPLGVRALSNELGVEPLVLAVPLRELRAAGKIRKHGEKRNTTYSRA